MMRCDEKRGGVYLIECLPTGKVYIGSSLCIKGRIRTHLKRLAKGVHHSRHLQAAWNKHGSEAFACRVIEVVEVVAKIYDREQYWLDQFSAVEKGFNIQPNARGSIGSKRGPRSDDVKRKISLAHKGRQLSREHLAAIRKAAELRRGIKRGPMTASTKQRISFANKGRVFPPLSEESRAKISAALKGRKHTPASIEHFRIGQRNRLPATTETRSRQSLSQLERFRNGVPASTRVKMSQSARRSWEIRKLQPV